MSVARCSRCHRVLTDPYSVAVGMGPECRGGAAKKGMKFPKPRYAVRGGRVVFLGLTPGPTPAIPIMEKEEEDETL